MVVAMDPPWIVNLALLQRLLRIQFRELNNSPARLGNDPERRDAVVVGKVIPLRHVLARVDLDGVRVVWRCALQLVFEDLEVSGMFGTEAPRRPAVDAIDQVQIYQFLQLHEALCRCRGHAVVRYDDHVDHVGQIASLQTCE